MPTSLTIRGPKGPLVATLALPPSKSAANRALILAALAGNLDCVKNPGHADDTRILGQLLAQRPHEMHCGDGGTTFRFLLAWACVQHGETHFITGNKRLLQRPHAPLLHALRALGADLEACETGILVRGKTLKGGTVHFHSPASSQFLSALLLVAPCFTEGLQLHWTGTRLSTPYVQLTLDLLRHYGAHATQAGELLRVEHGFLQATPYTVPADWSAASFWYAMAALSPGACITLPGLHQSGTQGDEEIAPLLGSFTHTTVNPDGICLRHKGNTEHGPISADLQNTPDLFQPMAFLMAGLGREAHFTGLHNLPLKETDRLRAVADALHTLGCRAEYRSGEFLLSGPITNFRPAPFNPQGDHRMAMALAPLALVCEQITILHPEVVTKSYPGFWDEMERAGFVVRRA